MLVAAILVRWPGRGPWWPCAASVGLFGLVALVTHVGYAELTELHVPLGVAMIALVGALAIWAWRPAVRRVHMAEEYGTKR